MNPNTSLMSQIMDERVTTSFGVIHVILKTITRTRTLKGGGFGLTTCITVLKGKKSSYCWLKIYYSYEVQNTMKITRGMINGYWMRYSPQSIHVFNPQFLKQSILGWWMNSFLHWTHLTHSSVVKITTNTKPTWISTHRRGYSRLGYYFWVSNGKGFF